jgi:hypothetical protein
MPSFRRAPLACVLFALSLPARSTKWNLEHTSSSGAGEASLSSAAGAGADCCCCCARIFWSTCTVKIAWLLLLTSFMLVCPVLRHSAPFSRQSTISLQLPTATSLAPST